MTRRIRLGSAVCILPLYHPARLLAEVGFVDTVSNGRLDLGIGSGYQEFEFERFGVKLEDAHAMLQRIPRTSCPGDSRQKHLRVRRQVPQDAAQLHRRAHACRSRCRPSGSPRATRRRSAAAVREGHNLFVTALLNGIDAIEALRHRLERIAAKRQGRSIETSSSASCAAPMPADNDSRDRCLPRQRALPAPPLGKPEVPPRPERRRLYGQGGCRPDDMSLEPCVTTCRSAASTR